MVSLDDDAFFRADINDSLLVPPNPRQRVNTLMRKEQPGQDLASQSLVENQQMQQQFLTNSPQDPTITAEGYLQLMSSKCPLDQIYRVVMIGYKDQSKSVCPVLVEINQEKLRNYYDGKYLLQCWDRGGRVVYQRALKYPHLAWAISAQSNTFMFVLDPRDNRDEPQSFFFHIVQLNECIDLSGQSKVEFKIKDWTGLCANLLSSPDSVSQMSMALTNKSIFVVATPDSISSIDVTEYLLEAKRQDSNLKFEVDTSVTPTGYSDNPKQLHHLWEHQRTGLIHAAFSSSRQAILDFYELSFEIIPGLTKTEIIVDLRQICELAERRVPIAAEDTIDQVKFVTTTHQASFCNAAVVLRTSKNVDFYWENKLVFSSEEASTDLSQRVEFSEIHLSFEQIYLRQNKLRSGSSLEDGETDLKIKLDLAENISTEKGDRSKPMDLEAQRFFECKMIHNHYKPFQQFVCYAEYLCVGHGNTVSIFNTLTNEWEKHFSFSRQESENLLETMSTFDYRATNNVVCVFFNQYKNGEICVYCQDGSFKSISYIDENEKRVWKLTNLNQYKTKGSVVSITRDDEHQNMLMIITRDEETNQCSLYCFCKRIAPVIDFKGQFTLKSSTKVVSFFSPAENTQFLLINIDEGLMCIIELQFTLTQEKKIQMIQFLVKKIDYNKFKTVIGDKEIHSAVSTDLAKNLVLFDNEQMHVFDLNSETQFEVEVQRVVTHSKMFIRGVHLFNDRYLYALYNRKLNSNASTSQIETVSNGFGILDLDQLNTNVSTTPLLLPICDAIVGINNEFVFCEADKRIAFLQDYDKIIRVPLLHENSVVFQGIKPRSEYLAFQTIGNTFIALDARSRMYSWDLTTGRKKMLSSLDKQTSFVAASQQFEGYQTWQTPAYTKIGNTAPVEDDFFRDGHFQHVLIYKTEPEPDTPNLIKEFYAQRQVKNVCLGKTFAESMKQTFHRMKLIKIVSETQVQEVCSFLHVRLGDREQHLFFSADGSRMLEIDNGECRMFQYYPGRKFLHFVSRLSKIPTQLCNGNCLQIWLLFSPDLSQHLDFELKSKEYVIRDVLSGLIKFRISKEFLSTPASTKQVTEQLKFMTWVDNETLRLIDISYAEPFEKVIKTSSLRESAQTVEEVASTAIPYFDLQPYTIQDGDPLDKRTPGCNFFAEPVNLQSMTKNLQQKHQALKRLHYIDQHIGKTDSQVQTKEDESQDKQKDEVIRCLFDVNYKQKQLTVQMPFTIFHWRLIEYYLEVFGKTQGRVLSLQSFQRSWAVEMCLNILPNLKTFLHFAANQTDLLTFFQQQLQPSPSLPFVEIPFTRDYFSQTPLHLNFEEGQVNIECAAFFLNLLKGMPIDHHGKAIADIIYRCLEFQVSGVELYLQSRLLSTSQLTTLQKIANSSLKRGSGGEDDKDFVTSFELQPDIQNLKTKLFEEGEREANVKIKVWDIPFIHSPERQESKDFCAALESSFSEQLFTQPCVAAIIEYRWNVTYSAIIKWLFVPYIIYALDFAAYVLIQEEQNSLDESTVVVSTPFRKAACLIILIVMSLYFLCMETFQSDGTFLEYLKSPWNYLDFVPPTLILSTICIDLLIPVESEDPWFQTYRNSAYAVIALMLCLKLFYFMRIFRKTGYFISMLMSVVVDIRYFLLLYLLIHLAFYFSFAILTGGAYTFFDVFLMSNGQYNLDGWDLLKSPLAMKIFFILAVCTINVVMLNILIAIVGTTYQDVVRTQRQFSDLERLSLIIENKKFVSKQSAAALSKPNEYLVIATDANALKK